MGALYIAPRLKSFPAYLHGGGQEGNFRSGTEGTPAIFSFAAACGAGSASFKQDIKKERELLEYLIAELSALPGIHLNGAHAAPHILNIGIPGVPTQNSINILQDHGICVSAGSACAKGHRSHVLDAMKVNPEVIDGSFRVSLCRDTTKEELDTLITVIREEILPLDSRLSCRGIGMMWGVDCSKLGGDSFSGAVIRACVKRNLIIERAGRDSCVVKMMPALVIDDGALLKGLNTVKEAFMEVLGSK